MDEAQFKAMGEQLLAQLAPLIEAAADKAVTALAAANPLTNMIGAVAIPAVFDEVDALIAKMLGNMNAPAVNSDTSPAGQIASLQAHVAAIAVATGAATNSNTSASKAAALTHQASTVADAAAPAAE